jgi:hypothetical protein
MYNGKNFIVDPMGLEIFYKDLPPWKTFDQYKSLCLALRGDGWRIPTIEELSYMYGLHTLGILGFDSSRSYWSTSNKLNSLGHIKPYTFQCISFSNGDLSGGVTLSFKNVINARPVRTISL